MSRLPLLRFPCLILALALLLPGTSSGDERPNILFFLSDDHGVADSGAYGHPVIRTPGIDRLAREGLRFLRGYTGTAMCAPSRSQLFTGLHAVRNGAFPNHSRIRPGVRTLPQYLKPAGYRVALAGKVHVKPKMSFPFEYLERDVASMRKFLESAGDDPFCLVVSTNDPHTPWKPARDYSADRVVLPPRTVDTPETREALARYYQDVSDMDAELVACLALLDELELTDETLTIYAGDHGPQFPFGKWTCYERGLRVPLVARWPGEIEPGSQTSALVQFVDVLPTLLEVAGVEPVQGLDGQSFREVLRGKTKTHHEVVFGIQTTRGIIRGSEAYPVRSIADSRYKLILNLNSKSEFQNVLMHRDGEKYWRSWERKAKTDPVAARLVEAYRRRPEVEFYDLEEDPHETHNLAAVAEHRERVAAMRKRLESWMESQGDRSLETEMQALERQDPDRQKRRRNRERSP